MLKRMEKYLKRKKLLLNMEKSKSVCFRRGRRRRKKTEWNWEDQKIKEMNEFKYLEYVVKKNGVKKDRSRS